MAERRMFAKTIIDSDAFLDMPLSAQALYFHLSMRADDDGFVNNPKKIQRLVCSSDDDLKLLIAKSFLIPFETGIVVIKHWKIHNYIRGDRKHDTKYPEEMALLTVKENGAYSLKPDLKELEIKDNDDSTSVRKKAYAESSLPYSFDYKIRHAFWGKKCPLCGCDMCASIDEGIENHAHEPSIQHNIPISKGGKHELGNISVICHQCNITLQDKITDKLNADDVIKEWDKIVRDYRLSDKCQADDGQVTDICPTEVRLGKDSIGKDSIGNIISTEQNQIDSIQNTENQCTDIPTIPTSDGTEWEMPSSLYNEFVKAYPALSIKQEVSQMRIWSLSNPTKRKTKRGMARFVNSWLDRSQNNASKKKQDESYGAENIKV